MNLLSEMYLARIDKSIGQCCSNHNSIKVIIRTVAT